jgi:hypothetical protein
MVFSQSSNKSNQKYSRLHPTKVDPQ